MSQKLSVAELISVVPRPFSNSLPSGTERAWHYMSRGRVADVTSRHGRSTHRLFAVR